MTYVDDDLRTISAAIHVLSRTLRRAAAVQVGLEPLPGSEFDVIAHIGSHPGSTVSDVARGLGMQTSNVSTAVRNLAARGLVDRVPDPHDQRRVRLWSSVAAERHREALEATWSSALERLLDDLPDGDAAHLLAAAPALRQLAELTTTESPRPAGRAVAVPVGSAGGRPRS